MSFRASAFRGLIPLAVAMALAGCGTSQRTALPRESHPLPPDTLTFATREIGHYGGRFVIGETAAPKTFNSIMANETSTTDVTQRLFIGLADFNNGTQEDYPVLAKSWDTSADGLAWTFHLRRGAAFSDGVPITSEDVLFSFQVVYDDSLHPSVQDLVKIDGKPFALSAPDSYTVVIEIPRPYALFIPAVGSVTIMPKHKLAEAYAKGEFASAYGTNTPPAELVSSGPWRLKSYVAGEKTVLEPNPYWFGTDAKGQRLPYLDELAYLIVPDQNTAALKFQSGEVDALDNVKPEDYKTFEDGQEAGHYKLYDIGPSLNTNFFWFNLNKVREARSGKRIGDPQVGAEKYHWFSQRDFRRAMSMAVDREAIIRGPFYGYAVKNWMSTTSGNHKWHSEEVSGADYDPEGAKRLLAGLGYRDRDGDGILEDDQGRTISFTMKTNGDNNVRMGMMNLIRDDLAQVGVKMIPAPVEFTSLITNLRNDFNYEAALLGLSTGVPPDPGMGQNVWRSSGLTHYWNIKQPRPETPAEARINALMDENVGTTDLAVRQRTWHEIAQIANDEAFLVWLPTQLMRLPVRDRFGNVEPSPIPHRILWNSDRIFLKSAR